MAPPVFFHRLAPPWVAHPENSDFISTPNSEHERRAARKILCVYFIFEKSWVAVKLYQGHLMSTKVSHSGVSPTRLWRWATAVIFWQFSFYLQSTIKSMWFLTLCRYHYQSATFHVGEWRRCKRMEARHQVGWDCSCMSHSFCLFFIFFHQTQSEVFIFEI